MPAALALERPAVLPRVPALAGAGYPLFGDGTGEIVTTQETERPFGPGHPDWRPPRGYSRPPFAPGHTLSLRHGVYSPRTWRPLADAIASELSNIAPWCNRPTYGSAVAAWARVEAQLQLVMAWLDEHGPLDADGHPRPAAALLARLESQAQSLRAELGLSPLSLARLLAAFTSTPAGTDDDALERLKAEGRRLVEARAGQLGASVPGLPAETAEAGSDAIGASDG